MTNVLPKDANPKTAFGLAKPSLQFVPLRAVFVAGLAHMQGALKYGPFNWRKQPVSASTYVEAALRHINEWREGGETASDSGVHHLGHAIACMNILIDAQLHGTLIDDRNKDGVDYDKFYEDMKPTISRIINEWGGEKK